MNDKIVRDRFKFVRSFEDSSPRLKVALVSSMAFYLAVPFSWNIPTALLDLVISSGNGDIEIVFPGHEQKEYEI